MGKGAERGPVELLTVPSHALPPKRAHNFSAGAAMFDTQVMTRLQAEFLSYNNSGMGLVVSRSIPISVVAVLYGCEHGCMLKHDDRLQEMSQRDPGGPVQLVIGRAEANLRQLLAIPDNYKVLFFQVELLCQLGRQKCVAVTQ